MSAPADTIRRVLRAAEYFDSEDGSDAYVDALAELDALVADLAAARQDAERLREALRVAYPYMKDALDDPDGMSSAIEKIIRDDILTVSAALRGAALADSAPTADQRE